ncbi:MAG: Rpn family recombination-promoting nuclease/putative transposase [Synergistaceae bacterium]|nr:Rpn family recombination-promoting nuclease/putative transposase [Synergistaceae bacterium]
MHKNDDTELMEIIRPVIEGLTLMDDRFMARFLQDSIPCVSAIIRLILNRPDLVIKESHTQFNLSNFGHALTIDVLAQDSEGKLYNIEVQNSSAGASEKRARFHSAVLDAHTLAKGKDFPDLPETYVIFMTREDFFKHGKSVYTINRYVEGFNKPFEDELHIMYVNCSAKDDGSEVWKLIHDMTCPDPDKMLVPELAKRMKHFKRTKKGGKEVSDWLENLTKELVQRAEERGEERGEKRGEKRGEERGEKRAKENFAVRLLNEGLTALDRIAMLTGLPLAEVTRLDQTLKA